ncbi:MAG: hypothetical protein MUF15_19750, partial [Acidobacteria bacterium]|nr:hypothetical protein [Acidobacteriota bacterium]
MKRSEMLLLMAVGGWAISVHEHIGCERLAFENGIENNFKQDIDTLFGSLSSLDWYGRPVRIASVVMTMPHFRFSKTSGNAEDGYAGVNAALLSECNDWFLAHPDRLPLPFLSVDVHDNICSLERLVEDTLHPVMGIKLHPRARGFSIKDLLDSELLPSASRMGMPVLMHCSGRD